MTGFFLFLILVGVVLDTKIGISDPAKVTVTSIVLAAWYLGEKLDKLIESKKE